MTNDLAPDDRTPPAALTATDGFELAAQAADCFPGTLLGVTLADGLKVCLAHTPQGWFACVDKCPHADYPMSEGYLDADGTVECGWHGAKFRCGSGAVCRGPATEALTLLDIEERDGALWVRRRA